MKFKFLVSQTTTIDPQIIIDLINLKLKDKKYRVQSITHNSVIFRDNPWAFRWRHQAIRRLDGGAFKINVSENSATVSLNYYLNMWPLALTLVAAVIIPSVCAKEYGASVFFLCFFSIAIVYQCLISKGVAREMLAEILNKNEMN